MSDASTDYINVNRNIIYCHDLTDHSPTRRKQWAFRQSFACVQGEEMAVDRMVFGINLVGSRGRLPWYSKGLHGSIQRKYQVKYVAVPPCNTSIQQN